MFLSGVLDFTDGVSVDAAGALSLGLQTDASPSRPGSPPRTHQPFLACTKQKELKVKPDDSSRQKDRNSSGAIRSGLAAAQGA